jgi:hypothetical protein
MPPDELRKRRARWRFFQIAFAVTYLGVVLDVVTTALGFQKTGSGYEQNPLGSVLIGGLGWIGLFLLMSLLCAVCYVSFRTVYWRMSTRWSMILNIVLVLVAAFRWLAVVTAILYLLQA